MYVIRVLPIARGIFKDTLDYFTSEPVAPGSLVSVPVQKRMIPALVVESKEAAQEKTEIKQAPYRLRRIERVRSAPFLLPEFMDTVAFLARFYAGSRGQVLSQTLSGKILESLTLEKSAPHARGKRPEPADAEEMKLKWEGPLIVQATDDERLAYYRTRIRESFARKQSVYLCLPTIVDVERMADQFERGIRKYTVALHGNLGKKKLESLWHEALESKHALLIIATGGFLFLPRRDIGLIILDKEGSPAYKTRSRPFIDFRHAARFFAERRRINLIEGDIVLRTETVYEKESGRAHPRSQIKYRILSHATSTVASMKTPGEGAPQEPFRVISDELYELVGSAVAENENTFVYANRKGLATFTVCGDCGTVHICERCRSPFILYRTKSHLFEKKFSFKEPTFYLCHKCGAVESSETTCKHCASWKLAALGIGIERVAEEIKRRFPRTKTFAIDGEHVKTRERGLSIVEAFSKTAGSILFGTEAAFLYLNRPLENVVVASIDSFLTIPDYRMRERVLNILVRSKMLATKRFLVQTRNADWPFFEYVQSGNLLNFYRDELDERKQFQYPPFRTLIKISRAGEPDTVWREMKHLHEALAPCERTLYPSFAQKARGKETVNILLKLKKDEWPSEQLEATFSALGPDTLIEVNPADIL